MYQILGMNIIFYSSTKAFSLVVVRIELEHILEIKYHSKYQDTFTMHET